MTTSRTLAETWLRLLAADAITFDQLVAWADDRIAELATPPYWLIAVSTARSVSDAAEALRDVAGVADASAVWRAVAQGLLDALVRDPECDSRVGEYLYHLGVNGEAPSLGTPAELMSFWDAIDLARTGIYGDLESERQRLRDFLAQRSAPDETQETEPNVAAGAAGPRRIPP